MRQKTIKQSIFPFLLWWPKVNRKNVKADFWAGLTGAVIALPQGVAFAMIAGLPPEYGLYSAMVIPIIASLFGSSWQLVSGPTTPISIVVFAAISQFAEPGSADFVQLALALALYTGVIQLILGLARMGTLVNFVSHSVIIAFTAGAAILIATSQMKHVLGVSVERGLPFLENWGSIFSQINDTNFYVLTVAMSTLFTAILMRKLLPKFPYMLIAMIVGSIVNFLISGSEHGVELIGTLPSHLPPPSLPDVSLTTIQKLGTNAFAIALLGLVEAVSIARAIATQTHQRIDGNQEFIGQGLSNLIGSFFSCYPGSGSFTRSGINQQAGAETPLASIFSAIMLAMILLFIAPLTAYLPIPALGGIIMLVAYNLIDFHHIRSTIKISKEETAVMLITFLATLFLNLEFAIYLGVILSLVFYLQKTSKPRGVVLAPGVRKSKRKFYNIKRIKSPECPQLKVVRIDGSLFFGAINHIGAFLQKISAKNPEQNHILIVADGINFIDMEGAEFLVQEAERWRENGGHFYLCGIKKRSRDLLQKGGYWEKIGDENIFGSKQEAIAMIFPRLNSSICAQCTKRIFWECKL
ncbi:MAG: SulP family inorganic anion transporter [Bacteroidetes bacterium]|nr:SulP family inorganic anion transporter [Bacteroidota bacterium]